MPRLFIINAPSAKNSSEDRRKLKDVEFALKNSTWGSRVPYTNPKNDVREKDILLVGLGYFNPAGSTSPRQDDSAHVTAGFQKFLMCRVTSDPRQSKAPLWPDEVSQNSINYVTQLPFELIADGGQLMNADFSSEYVNAVKVSRNSSLPTLVNLSDAEANHIASVVGTESWEHLIGHQKDTPDIDALFPPEDEDANEDDIETSAGRESDPKVRRAIELRAVLLARQYYESQGWTVREEGKPFDLECTRDNDSPLLVEVKGKRATSPGKIIVTRNEIKSARGNRQDLFIVTAISIERSDADIVASGGVCNLFSNWTPRDEDLEATTFDYTIPWNSAVEVDINEPS
ncbi:hypothetical protein CKALI_03730 [Corynebacterium kalinowskii]|uniref:Protein NO VEIN C-terminal domain-containing protein n=1 Tax=Corynebacterium kalinowskii TaxID=2675216 RepID=A0A6B8VPY0_9CORY|nr:DUF3883 domain-containing protein [Corynebacterium kalinowskii]QGU01627.1 hypothetical protein CKALI_03730 [Corynebacterium kalinowskii]